MNLPELWKPQIRAIEYTTEAIFNGERRNCLVLPTGGGKSRVAWELCRDWLHCGYSASVYTNRNMLIEQLIRTATDFGLKFGVRSAGFIAANEMPSDHPLQISSIQTEDARVLKKKVWQLHKAQRVIIDEAHLNCGETMQEIIRRHIEDGASIVGLTATPLDIGHVYDNLIIAGTNSELRECGALVCAETWGPDEPDCKKIKKQEWEYTENDVRKVMQVQKIFGRVLEWFNRLNPEHKPTILFAPGVPESIWFAEEFAKRGISAAHIDGKTCVYNGERYDTGTEIRAEIMRASKNGEVKILCNRFVLREGIDAPWIEHMILATVFGSLQSYLQSLGRGLRASDGKLRCVVQDHGGNWHRHDSANKDRHWQIDDTEAVVQGTRKEQLINKKIAEPMRCPQCAKILMTNRCPCGFIISQKTRPVIMEDGSLRDLKGDIFKPRFTSMKADTHQLWERSYFRGKNSKKGMTFGQVYGMFYYENGYLPPRNMPYMPKNERDWFRKVKDVPRSELL